MVPQNFSLRIAVDQVLLYLYGVAKRKWEGECQLPAAHKRYVELRTVTKEAAHRNQGQWGRGKRCCFIMLCARRTG